MAEAELIEEQPTLDEDVLPDDVEPESGGIQLIDQLDEGNLVDELDKMHIGAAGVAAQVLQLYNDDYQTMKKWRDRYTEALKLAMLEADAEKKTFPFEDASTVMMPFILESMLDFHSRTVPELVWSKDVVATKIYGKETPEKTARADRVSAYMNYQISEDITYWRAEQDTMLLALPCVGTAYKKTYFNSDEGEVRSDMLEGDAVVFNHKYRTFAEAPDKCLAEEYTRNEVLTFIRGDQQWKLDEDVLPLQIDHPTPFEFIRAYTWLDLDDDGLTEPYEVVVYKADETVVSVYPAYDEDDITDNDDGEIVNVKMSEIFTQYRFLPDPEGGPMGLGWGILLGDLFKAINTSVRQMIDAGTLSNLAGNSGLIDAQMSGASARGNRQQSGPIEVRMGELTPITTGGKPLGQSVVQFPYSGPNQALFQLTEYMVQQARTMTNAALNMDTNTQEAAMMYLARLQQGLKVPNSIVMRVYECAKDEFTKIALLNFKHHSNEKYNRVLDEETPANMKADFNPEDCDIRTAADPSQGSDIERQQRSQIVLEEAKVQPQQILNLRQAYLDWLDAMNVPDAEALAPEPSGEPDPMQKLMVANMQREAELAQKEMDIREERLELDRNKEMLKALREGAEYGLKFDKTEADIARQYAEAFHRLWEMGMAGDDPVRTVQDIERRLIDREASAPPPVPLESPRPNPPATEGAPPSGY